jgi:hypothetical protein
VGLIRRNQSQSEAQSEAQSDLHRAEDGHVAGAISRNQRRNQTCIEPRMVTSQWPPRIIPKEASALKYEAPGSAVT